MQTFYKEIVLPEAAGIIFQVYKDFSSKFIVYIARHSIYTTTTNLIGYAYYWDNKWMHTNVDLFDKVVKVSLEEVKTLEEAVFKLYMEYLIHKI